MAADILTIVTEAVRGLGFELVDFERAGGGMMRVFIDKPGGISVENCADVSNHLTRLFLVEELDYSRLEVSSPGLDRPLKTIDDFNRFMGSPVKVRLHSAVDNRKRFDGVVELIDADAITFKLIAELPKTAGAKVKSMKKQSAKPKAETKSADGGIAEDKEKKITVLLSDIDRARLIPEI